MPRGVPPTRGNSGPNQESQPYRQGDKIVKSGSRQEVQPRVQEDKISKGLKMMLMLRGFLTLSEILEDEMFGDEDDLQNLLLMTDASIAYAFIHMKRRGSSPRPSLRVEAAPTLKTVAPELCRDLFRFELPELVTMTRALGWEGKRFRIHTGHALSQNWYIADGDTILLMLLYRFASPARTTSMPAFFQCGPSKISTIVNWSLDWIYEKFVPQVNNLLHWEPHFEGCADHLLHHNDCPYERMIGFLDGTLVHVPKPHSKSLIAGGIRQSHEYNGHLRKDGVIFLSIVMPSGFFLTYGPWRGTTDDTTCYASSGVDGLLRALHARTGKCWSLFGDPAFGSGPHMAHMFPNPGNDERMIVHNEHMEKIRVIVNWGFPDINRLLPYVSHAPGLRLGTMPLDKIFSVAAFFKNCHNAAYGNEIGNHLGSLELARTVSLWDYMRMGQRQDE